MTDTATLEATRLFPSPAFPTVPVEGERALYPGHRILYTGTPAGVVAVVPGDVIAGTIDGLLPVELTVGEPE